MPSQTQLHKEIVDHLYNLHRAMRQHSEDCGPAIRDLTLLQMQALSHIKHQGRIKMSDLAQALHVSPAALSVLINRLVKLNWLTRSADEHDRRLVYIQLTTQSATQLTKLQEQKMKWLKEVFDQLSTSQLKAFHQTLNQISTIISQPVK